MVQGDYSPGSITWSTVLANILLRLCVWGLVATLLLHLIEIRSLFIPGGEGRIAWALLSFILGVILLEDMEINLGPSTTFAYSVALFCAISFFNFYIALVYRMPINWILWFAIHEILIVVIWIVTHRITRACAVRDKKALAAAGDGGIFSQHSAEAEKVKEQERELQAKQKHRLLEEEERRIREQSLAELSTEDIFNVAHGTEQKKLKQRMEAAEQRIVQSRPDWSKKMSGSHPGWILVWFSLVAIPLFGLGIYLFDFGEPSARIRTAIRFFIYLWCLMALFCLASLNQLRAYFRNRKVSMPDSIGFVWISLGLILITLVLSVSFFLPQPHTMEGAFIREHLIAEYGGVESDWGFKEQFDSDKSVAVDEAEQQKEGDNGQAGDREGDTQTGESQGQDTPGGGEQGSGGGDGGGGDGQKAQGSTPQKTAGEDSRKSMEMRREAAAQRMALARDPNLGKGFDHLLGAMKMALGIACVVLAVALILMFLARARSSANRLAALRRRNEPKAKKRLRERLNQGRARKFSEYKSPFGAGDVALEEERLVQYCWAALTAVCEDKGDPVEAGQTPDEYLATQPEALRGFEQQARWLAELLIVREFSGQKLRQEDYDGLRAWWLELRRFAERGA